MNFSETVAVGFFPLRQRDFRRSCAASEYLVLDVV